MRKLLVVAVVVFLAAFAGNWVGVHAQTSQVLQVSGSWSTHTACALSTGQTTICLASDGLWLSLNGAAFTQLGVAAPGVTSLNGKQGALIISASGSLPTTAPAITVTVQ